jgi:hypothetical protein
LFSLGVLEYSKSCVNDFFVEVNSEEESCYTYGTTVVRRSSDGNTETIPIEDVKEGEQILAMGS